MKTTLTNSLVTTALLLAWMPANVLAGGAVTTGTVTAVVKEAGTLTVMSDQTHGPLNYTGMDKITVMFGSGKAATLADVAVGQMVTVEYAVRDGKTVTTKLMLPDPKPVVPLTNPVPLTAAERKALDSKAAKDNDITTQPGSKARLDNDITTKPGKKDPTDPDITKVPGK